jgi:hypothetical protein
MRLPNSAGSLSYFSQYFRRESNRGGKRSNAANIEQPGGEARLVHEEENFER